MAPAADREGKQERVLAMKNQPMKKVEKVIFLLLAFLLPLLAGCANLHKAAGKGDLAEAERFLQKGADVNARDAYGRTPLMWALDNPEIVRFLVENGADVNARDVNGETALMKAAFLCRLEVVKYLAEKGADVNARSERGATPLMWAVGDLEIVKFLTEKGADINAWDVAGETLLLKAAVLGKLSVVRYLLDKGATVETGVEQRKAP